MASNVGNFRGPCVSHVLCSLFKAACLALEIFKMVCLALEIFNTKKVHRSSDVSYIDGSLHISSTRAIRKKNY